MKTELLDAVESKHPVRLMSRNSMSLPLHCTAMGKAYLAELSEDRLTQLLRTLALERFTADTILSPTQLASELRQIRDQGFAIEDQELYPDVWVVAAPVRDYMGQFVAAISIEVPVCRVESVDLQSLMADFVMKAAGALSRELGFDPTIQFNDDISVGQAM